VTRSTEQLGQGQLSADVNDNVIVAKGQHKLVTANHAFCSTTAPMTCGIPPGYSVAGTVSQ